MVRLYINVSLILSIVGIRMRISNKKENENFNYYLGIYPIDDSILAGHYYALV
jgi:hypothetical protein